MPIAEKTSMLQVSPWKTVIRLALLLSVVYPCFLINVALLEIVDKYSKILQGMRFYEFIGWSINGVCCYVLCILFVAAGCQSVQSGRQFVRGHIFQSLILSAIGLVLVSFAWQLEFYVKIIQIFSLPLDTK